MDSFASQGVHTGRDYTPKEWEKNIRRMLGQGLSISTVYRSPTRPFILFDEDGNINVEDFKLNIGVYMYNENLLEFILG